MPCPNGCEHGVDPHGSRVSVWLCCAVPYQQIRRPPRSRFVSKDSNRWTAARKRARAGAGRVRKTTDDAPLVVPSLSPAPPPAAASPNPPGPPKLPELEIRGARVRPLTNTSKHPRPHARSGRRTPPGLK